MVSHAASITPRGHTPRLKTNCRALSSWAPKIDPLTLMSQDAEEPTYLWAPGNRPTWVGIGCHRKIISQGPERFLEQETQAQEILSQIEGFSLDGAPAPHPRLFGGFAFNDEPLPEVSPWAGFSNSAFILPKWSYECDETRAWITVYYGENDSPEDLRQAALRRIQDLQAAKPRTNSKTLALTEFQEPLDSWAKRIEAIKAQISSGAAQKIVAARQNSVTSESEFRLLDVLRELQARDPSSVLFAFPSANSVFTGATPETLLSKHALHLQTEALAGTIDANQLRADALLQESLKDHDEHNFVRSFILEKLEPICGNITHASAPELRHLKDVIHLSTPISGELKRDQHILKIVKALHPTPAVAGIPAQVAHNTIRQSEPFSRGWYAGPIGWFDKQGDGEFAVALRCGLISENRAHIFSGAGIVNDSETLAEYEETRLKQQAFLHALR